MANDGDSGWAGIDGLHNAFDNLDPTAKVEVRMQSRDLVLLYRGEAADLPDWLIDALVKESDEAPPSYLRVDLREKTRIFDGDKKEGSKRRSG